MSSCAWENCPNPADYRETVRNSKTGEEKDVDLCLLHRQIVWELDGTEGEVKRSEVDQ